MCFTGDEKTESANRKIPETGINDRREESDSGLSDERSRAVARFTEILSGSGFDPHALPEQQLWDLILAYEQEIFYTFRGLQFRYSIRGYEMFIDRKEKSVTRSTIMMAARQALSIRCRGEAVSGPKKLGTFGASYLYPVFQIFGLIE